MGRTISVLPAPLHIYTRARPEGALIVAVTIIRSPWVSPGNKLYICLRRSVVCVYVSWALSSGSRNRLETCSCRGRI